MNRMIIASTGWLLTVAACGGGEQGTDKEGTIYRTMIQFRPDGSSEVRTYQVDRAQQQSDVAARERRARQEVSGNGIGTSAQAISADPNCDGADLWLFDDVNQTGRNELCLFGPGVAGLQDYQTRYCDLDRCVFSDWVSHVRSYWAGVASGSLHNPVEISGQDFSPWQRVDVAAGIAYWAHWVVLDF